MIQATELATLVDAQVAAYNDHDIERFLRCFTEDFQFFDFPATLRFAGQEEGRLRYGALFEAHPKLKAQITKRIVVPPFVVDHEFLYGHGRRPDGVNGIVTYQFDDGLIARVWSGAWSDQAQVVR